MYYSIAQAAQISGITAHTLRYYDKEGLLPFVERSSSGIRRFKEDDFSWLATITCLKNTGMPVKQIKQFIEWCMEGDSALEQRLNVFLEQKKRLQEQIDVLNKCMEKIDYKIWYYNTALEAGTEAVHAKTAKKCLDDVKYELSVLNRLNRQKRNKH